jgi:ribulose-phosphate 3-epimerase
MNSGNARVRRPAEIVPAVLEESYRAVETRLDSIAGSGARKIQLDVCDGVFVPRKSWPYVGDSGEWVTIKREAKGLPRWEEFDFEIDLMVVRPEEVMSDWICAGASRVFVHVDASPDFESLRSICRNGTAELGLAVHPNTPPERLLPLITDDITAVQCMGISRVGFQGEPFDERVFEIIKELRTRKPALVISVDGGVNFQNARNLLSAGANYLVVGSSIFGSPEPRAAFKRFQELIGA